MSPNAFGHSTIYYSHSNNVLYRSFRKEWHQQGTFCFDCHQGTDEETFNYNKFHNVAKLPDDAVPVDVMDAIAGWRITFYQTLEVQEKPPISPKSFMEELMQQPEYISQYYTHIEFHTVPIQIYEHLKSSRKVLIATSAIRFK
jgi:hypothetical protein